MRRDADGYDASTCGHYFFKHGAVKSTSLQVKYERFHIIFSPFQASRLRMVLAVLLLPVELVKGSTKKNIRASAGSRTEAILPDDGAVCSNESFCSRGKNILSCIQFRVGEEMSRAQIPQVDKLSKLSTVHAFRWLDYPCGLSLLLKKAIVFKLPCGPVSLAKISEAFWENTNSIRQKKNKGPGQKERRISSTKGGRKK